MHNFLHASQASSVSHAFGGALEVFAYLRCDGNRSPNQIVPSSPSIDVEAAHNVVNRLLLEPGNGKQLFSFAERFKLFDALDPEQIVDLFGRLRTNAGNLYHLGKAEWYFLLQFF